MLSYSKFIFLNWSCYIFSNSNQNWLWLWSPAWHHRKQTITTLFHFAKKKPLKKLLLWVIMKLCFSFIMPQEKEIFTVKSYRKKVGFFSLYFSKPLFFILSVQNLSSTLLLNLTQVTHKLWKVFTLKFDGSNSSNWNYFLLNNKIHTFRNFYFILNLWFKNWK